MILKGEPLHLQVLKSRVVRPAYKGGKIFPRFKKCVLLRLSLPAASLSLSPRVCRVVICSRKNACASFFQLEIHLLPYCFHCWHVCHSRCKYNLLLPLLLVLQFENLPPCPAAIFLTCSCVSPVLQKPWFYDLREVWKGYPIQVSNWEQLSAQACGVGGWGSLCCPENIYLFLECRLGVPLGEAGHTG